MNEEQNNTIAPPAEAELLQKDDTPPDTVTDEETSATAAEPPDHKAEENDSPIEIVGVGFRTAGKSYYFSPRGYQLERGTSVIVETAQKYLDEQGGGEVAQNLTGCSLKTLLWEVANGNPVITWVTINLTSRVEERYYWTTPKGEDAVFLINEHCVLLCGYDLNANTVTVCDPLEGKIQYDMDKFEDRYQLVYQQAVVLRKPESLTGTETETTEMFVQ